MRVGLYTRLILSAVFFLKWTACSPAQERATADNQALPAVARAAGSSGAALLALQRAHERDGSTFIDEGDLDPLIPESGGGACASAAGIDAMQALRVMAGL